MKIAALVVAVILAAVAVYARSKQQQRKVAVVTKPEVASTTSVATSAAQPDEFETKRVKARIKTSASGFGEIVVFSFPKNPYDCDRGEIFDLINSDEIGGSTYQGGGSPGAPICAVFRAAKTRERLRELLPTIMPRLDALMTDITNGVPIPKPPPSKIIDKEGREWPECVPGQHDGSSFSMYSEPEAYVCSAEGRWIRDEESIQRVREHQQDMRKDAMRANELFRALSTRVLTYEEMLEVARFGNSINTSNGESYNAKEKMQELNNVLLIQQMLQSRHATEAKP